MLIGTESHKKSAVYILKSNRENHPLSVTHNKNVKKKASSIQTEKLAQKNPCFHFLLSVITFWGFGSGLEVSIVTVLTV